MINTILHMFATHGHREHAFKEDIFIMNAVKIDHAIRNFQDTKGDRHAYVVLNAEDQVAGLRGLRVKRIIEDYRFVAPAGWYELKKEITS